MEVSVTRSKFQLTYRKRYFWGSGFFYDWHNKPSISIDSEIMTKYQYIVLVFTKYNIPFCLIHIDYLSFG